MATVRQQMVTLLERGEWSSVDISKELSIEERDVFTHLRHIRKSRKDRRLVVIPYRCISCTFQFRKRSRLDRPGRCPQCKGSHISMALFSLSK